MSKFLVQGRDAGERLNRLCTSDVDGPEGLMTYTQWLDEEGKMQADLTVSKLGPDKYFVVATDTMHRHVETHARKHLTHADGRHHVTLTDVTGGIGALFSLLRACVCMYVLRVESDLLQATVL